MSTAPLPELPDIEALKRLSPEQLVSIIVQQQQLIVQQQQAIEQLTLDVNRLKANQNLDSQTTSSPPSTDLLKKPEKAKAPEPPSLATDAPKRKPGGQPGHPGKTRKGNGQDRPVRSFASPSLS